MVLSSSRGHGVDRFYTPPALRRQRHEQQQQQHQAEPEQKPTPLVVENRVDSGDSSSKPSVPSTPSSSPPPPAPPPCSNSRNLERFLEAITPVVAARYSPKAVVRGYGSREDVASMPYFVLGDLWESFGEWSAYGAGVPLVLDGTDCVYQYYVPYLSAIQLYVDSSRPVLRSRPLGEESDGEAYLESTSDGTSGQEGSSSDDGEVSKIQKLPIFEFVEHDQPYKRKPLADKMSALANNFPGLSTYKSCDLHPSSWISVAWYPIYRIPTGPILRDLDACFLTYHLLGTPSKEFIASWSESNWSNPHSHSSMLEKVSLPVFGLASYKLRGSIWISSGPHEWQSASLLLQAADNWLHGLGVDHPDYRFFTSHSNMTCR